MQFVIRLLPSPEFVCEGQFVHVDSEVPPVSLEYLPDAHKTHDDELWTDFQVPAIHAEHPEAPVEFV